MAAPARRALREERDALRRERDALRRERDGLRRCYAAARRALSEAPHHTADAIRALFDPETIHAKIFTAFDRAIASATHRALRALDVEEGVEGIARCGDWEAAP